MCSVHRPVDTSKTFVSMYLMCQHEFSCLLLARGMVGNKFGWLFGTPSYSHMAGLSEPSKKP